MKKKKALLVVAICLALIVAGVLIFRVVLLEKDARREFSALLAEHGIERPNIVFITLDTLRADHLPCYGYSGVKTPHLDAQLKRGSSLSSALHLPL